MQCWRKLVYILLLFSAITAAASAQDGYVVSMSGSIEGSPDYKPTSFWQLPGWIQLFYITAMTAAFIGTMKLMPLVLGKIDDLLKNENRHNILNYIHANPGTTIARISEVQQIDRGTVKYHLYKLESEGKIIFRRMGKFSRLFRNSGTFGDDEQKVIAHLQNRNSRAILLLVLAQPGITNQELAERLGIEKSAIHWHMEKFISDGLIRFVYEGKFKRYFIIENALKMLQKHTGQSVT